MQTLEASLNRYFVNDWLIETEINRISNGEEIHKVEPRIIRLLTYLVQNQNQICSKEDLIRNVWEGMWISENTLSGAIKSLRKIFKDDWQQPTCIETISKSGYRLVATVRFDGETVGKSDLPNNTAKNRLMFLIVLSIVGLLFFFTIFQFNKVQSTSSSNVLIPTLVSALPGPEFQPKISPDGNQVAFIWEDPKLQSWNIYVKTIGTENALRLTKDPGTQVLPAWSPDGQFIAYKGATDKECGIYKIPVLGGTPVKLIECTANINHISWSPDGDFLTYDKVPAEGLSRIALLDLQTLKELDISAPESNSFGDVSPVFSPEGNEIAFLRNKGQNHSDIFSINVNTFEVKPITNENRFIASFDWNDDGSEIIYVSDRGGFLGLWRLTLASGRSEMAVISGKTAFNPSHSRQNNNLVFSSITDDTNIWTISLEGRNTSEKQMLSINSSQKDLQPQISPTNKKIAFISDRNGFMELYSCTLKGDDLIKHTDFGEFYLSTPRWSPDSEKILFHKWNKDGIPKLFVVNANSTLPAQLSTDESGGINGNWSNDGKKIYFSTTRSGQWEIWKMAENGANPIQVTTNGGFNSLEGLDGENLYFVKHSQSGIWRKLLTDNNEELVIPGTWSLDWGNWTISEDGIYFVSRVPFANISFFDFETTTISNLTGQMELDIYGSTTVSISPDNKKLYFNQPDSWIGDIMMVKW